ncbi:hypothetical protein T492DRAFT_912166 [Pavlovales sp. CCMP2436]|nr:hypothetical protein T492DRAFT_912166 [Pavlovales sp. CCMP2436]
MPEEARERSGSTQARPGELPHSLARERSGSTQARSGEPPIGVARERSGSTQARPGDPPHSLARERSGSTQARPGELPHSLGRERSGSIQARLGEPSIGMARERSGSTQARPGESPIGLARSHSGSTRASFATGGSAILVSGVTQEEALQDAFNATRALVSVVEEEGGLGDAAVLGQLEEAQRTPTADVPLGDGSFRGSAAGSLGARKSSDAMMPSFAESLLEPAPVNAGNALVPEGGPAGFLQRVQTRAAGKNGSAGSLGAAQMGSALQRVATRMGEASQAEKKPSCLYLLGHTLLAFAGLLVAVAKAVLRELLYFALVLAPGVIAFLGHWDEPVRGGWRVWFGRPAYALLIARVLYIVLAAIFSTPALIRRLPELANQMVIALLGWPAVVILYLALTVGFTYHGAIERIDGVDQPWQQLRAVGFIRGVNLWLGVAAVSCTLAELWAQRRLRALGDLHFCERLDQALLSMRVVRLLFATGRAARKLARAARLARKLAGRRRQKLRRLSQDGAATSLERERLISQDGDNATLSRASSRASSDADSASDDGQREFALGVDLAEKELWVEELNNFSAMDSIAAGLAALRAAVNDTPRASERFATSLAEARARAGTTFAALLVEHELEKKRAEQLGVEAPVPSDGQETDGTIPRARLERWTSRAVRKRGEAEEEEVRARTQSIFSAWSHVSSAQFVSAVEAVYREQRFVNAAFDSLESLTDYAHVVVLLLWAVLVSLAGIFLVDWGFSLQGWVVPLSSVFISAAFLSGRVPYEVAAGFAYVLFARPYDVGDRVVITDPGRPRKGYETLIVAEVGLLSTRAYTMQGYLHSIQNFTVRNMSVINISRSRNPGLQVKVVLPIATPGPQILLLQSAVAAYVAQAPEDFSSCSSTISTLDHEQACIGLEINVQSVHAAKLEGLHVASKSKLHLFIHAYMSAAGIEYKRPRIVVRATLDGDLARRLAELGRAG